MTSGTATQISSALEFAPLPTAVPCARLHAIHVLREWGLRDLADDAQMIVSEHDLAPGVLGMQNVWVQGVGCGAALAHFA